MNKFFKSVILAVIAIAALVWACSFKFSGLAWFPGFLVALICSIRIFDIQKKTSSK